MHEPVVVVVYSDYLCPWCYVAAIRLQKLKDDYGDKINISWKSYPLVLNDNPNLRFSRRSIEARHRADLEEESITFRPWDHHQPYPTSSIPALLAVKCARLQGEEAFQRFHMALFKAFFTESQNISDRKILLNLAEKAELDSERFGSNLAQNSQEKEVLVEYEEAQSKHAGQGIPLAIIGDRYPLVGAVPISMYRRAVDLCLADQTG